MEISKKQFREICRISVRYSFAYCYLCGHPIEPGQEWNLDHKICKSHGGGNTADNLRPTHVACNSARGSMTLDEWFALEHNKGKGK